MVVPTYNERERIQELVRALFEAAAAQGIELEVVVVDDNSPDKTGELAAEMALRHRVRVVHRPHKLGLGSAVIAGFNVASAPVVGVLDADFSHPPTAVPRMYWALVATRADFVVASRYVAGGSTGNWPLRRRMLSRLGCLLARPLTPVRDATSGFFLLRPEVARRAPLRATGFKICLELLMGGAPVRVVEVPYVFDDRQEGASKMTASEGRGYLKQLARFYANRMTTRRAAAEYRQVRPDEVERFLSERRQPIASDERHK